MTIHTFHEAQKPDTMITRKAASSMQQKVA